MRSSDSSPASSTAPGSVAPGWPSLLPAARCVQPIRRRRAWLLGAVLAALASPTASAQVHYFPDGRPWSQRADGGPDAEVDGWYYNLGITGLRVQLIEEAPTHLLVEARLRRTRRRPGRSASGTSSSARAGARS